MNRQQFTDKAFATIPELQAINYHPFTYGIDNEGASYMVALRFGVFPLSSIGKIAEAIENLYPYGWVIAAGYDCSDYDCVEICSSTFDAEFFAGIEMNTREYITRGDWNNNNSAE